MSRIRLKAKTVDINSIEDQLKALGCNMDMDAFLLPEDAVFKKYVEYWKKNKKPPNQKSIAESMEVSASRVSDHLHALERKGRMIYTPKGWIPVVVQKRV